MSLLGKFDGWLLCSDIDGTLTDRYGNVGEKNRERINYFVENGGLYTISTGRLPDFIDKFNLPVNAPVIAANGTVLFDRTERKFISQTLLGENIDEIIRFVCEQKNLTDALRFSSADDTFVFQENEIDFDFISGSLSGKKLLKMVPVGNSPENADKLKAKLLEKFSADFCVEKSWDVGIEFMRRGADKAGGLKRLREHLKSRVIKCAAVGDYENDISILKAADIGCATANALASVKAAADVTVVSNNDDAIAYVIDNIIKPL